jgi:hypothetical protein
VGRLPNYSIKRTPVHRFRFSRCFGRRRLFQTLGVRPSSGSTALRGMSHKQRMFYFQGLGVVYALDLT